MDNMRKLNGGLAKIVESMNVDTTDEEISTMLGMTVGDLINAFNKFPVILRELSIEDLIDGLLAEDNGDTMGEKILEKLSLDPDDPEAEKKLERLGDEIEEFIKAMGVS